MQIFIAATMKKSITHVFADMDEILVPLIFDVLAELMETALPGDFLVAHAREPVGGRE